MALRRYSHARGRQATLFEALAEKFAMSRLGNQYMLHVAPSVDRFLIPRTNGRWSSAGKDLVGLLTTTGAKSGQERVNPTAAMRRDDHWLLAGSNYGRETAPGWVHNLRANPACHWKGPGDEGPKNARELVGQERDEAFEWIKDWYLGYAVYERMASHRTIAVFRLDDA